MFRISCTFPRPRALVTLLFVAAAAGGCARLSAPAEVRSQPTPSTAPASTANEADIRFMQDMIPHHQQALVMAGWAASHAAGADVRRLAERLIVSQGDEIALARAWLRSNGAEAAADSAHTDMIVHGTSHGESMPGMLTEEELARLNAARGSEFDRLFLEFMIRHHEGALVMVDRLFASQGAARDDDVFRFASDVFADQTAEIDRMRRMLESLPARP